MSTSEMTICRDKASIIEIHETLNDPEAEIFEEYPNFWVIRKKVFQYYWYLHTNNEFY